MRFSTLNESKLHNTLKKIYSEIYDGKTEVERYGHVYDIVTKNENIIEIQTKNLAKLLPKILDTIEKGHNIKIVHPIVIKKSIEMHSSDGTIISMRKSPKTGSIYDIFWELTGIYSVLLDKHFSLEIVEIDMIEERIMTEKPVQSKNGKRRFKKEWIKSDKRLDKIIDTRRFDEKKDFLDLLPKNLPQEFCAKDIKNKLKESKLSSRILNNANLIIWVFNKMELIEYTTTKNRFRYYKLR